MCLPAFAIVCNVRWKFTMYKEKNSILCNEIECFIQNDFSASEYSNNIVQ